MTASKRSHLSALLAPLNTLAELGLGRPTHMTLAAYLSHLTQMSLLPEGSSTSYLSLYHRLRFGSSDVSGQELEQSIQALQQLLDKVREASLTQRELWGEALQKPTTPQPRDEVENTPASDSSAASATSALALVASPASPVSPIKDAGTVPQKQGSERPTEKETSEKPHTPRYRPFPKQAEEPTTPIPWWKRFFIRPFWHHLWWLCLLVVLGGMFAVYKGAKHSSSVMMLRYRIQNSINHFFGFPQVTVPPRYLPESLRPEYQRRRQLARFTRYIIKRYPKNARLWRRLANYHSNRENYAEAITFYLRSLSLQPNSSRTLNDLAWLLCTADKVEYRDPIRALKLAERAYQLSKTPDIIDTLAEAAFLNGQIKRAIQLEQEALAQNPKEDRDHYQDQLKRFRRALRGSR